MSLYPVIDTILDRSVLGGYTELGYQARTHLSSWSELPPMDGKVVLVTGASSGIGLAAAEGFARLGAEVHMLARDEQRGARARSQVIAWSGNESVQLHLCDLSDLGAVRAFATRFAAAGSRLEVLVNNAGVLPGERTLSLDGIELTFATNVLGPFLLTNMLSGLLLQSAPARILNVSSGGMYTQRLHADDLQSQGSDFDGSRAYARSKRAQVVLTELWAERLAGSGVVAHAMHPGWVDTPGLASSLPGFHRITTRLLRSPAHGADTILWLGTAPEPAQSSGDFWQDRRRRPTHRVPWTRESEEERSRLWSECVRLSGWPETGAAPPSSERKS
ncbi:MAG: SDR family NAD(P)-dependent oxidoreductase [Solirubrobacterales bacterium]|nr:SDR family NAD(P)-dependent oxidoreductase [Solirubrobacterales bacterium]